jgi:hypothetical protein
MAGVVYGGGAWWIGRGFWPRPQASTGVSDLRAVGTCQPVCPFKPRLTDGD